MKLFAFKDQPENLTRDQMVDYIDDLEHRVRELTAPPSTAVLLQHAFKLQPGEARVLYALLPGHPKNKEQLRTALMPKNSTADLKVVDVRICTLRKKVRPHGVEIETIHSTGYRMTAGFDAVRAALAA